MGFSRQEYWSGLPISFSRGIFLTQELKQRLLLCRWSPALQVVSYFASSLLLCRWILHHWATRDSLYDVAELASKPWFPCYKNILNTIFQLYFIVSDKSQLGTYVLWQKKITSRQASILKYSAIYYDILIPPKWTWVLNKALKLLRGINQINFRKAVSKGIGISWSRIMMSKVT